MAYDQLNMVVMLSFTSCSGPWPGRQGVHALGAAALGGAPHLRPRCVTQPPHTFPELLKHPCLQLNLANPTMQRATHSPAGKRTRFPAMRSSHPSKLPPTHQAHMRPPTCPPCPRPAHSGCQYLTPRTPQFDAALERLAAEGAIGPWAAGGSVGTISTREGDGTFDDTTFVPGGCV